MSDPCPTILADLFGLDGQVAAVIGGAGRIGKVLCRALAEAGANVSILDVDASAAERIAHEIASTTSRQVLPLATDTTREDQLEAAVARITTTLGAPDILVNSAQFRGADFYGSDVESYPKQAWDHVLEVNLSGVHLACQAFARCMSRHRGGRIVNLASTYGVVSPDPRIYGTSGVNSPVSYAASKAGVIQLTRFLAVHLRERNIRVNCLVPGGVFDAQAGDFVERYAERTPLGRMATAEDYRGAVLFMVSAASAYMTGAVVTVDGGWTVW